MGRHNHIHLPPTPLLPGCLPKANEALGGQHLGNERYDRRLARLPGEYYERRYSE